MKLIRFLYIYTFAFSLFYFVYVYSIEFALWHDSKKGGCPDLRRLVVGVATSVSTHYSLKQYYVKCFIFKLYPYISGSNFHSALSPDSSFALYSLLSWSPVYCCLVTFLLLIFSCQNSCFLGRGVRLEKFFSIMMWYAVTFLNPFEMRLQHRVQIILLLPEEL